MIKWVMAWRQRRATRHEREYNEWVETNRKNEEYRKHLRQMAILEGIAARAGQERYIMDIVNRSRRIR